MRDQPSILVVDDNEDLLRTLSLILKRSGYCVDTADDGLSAVDKFRMRHFDVASLFVRLPDPLQLRRRVLTGTATHDVPTHALVLHECVQAFHRCPGPKDGFLPAGL